MGACVAIKPSTRKHVSDSIPTFWFDCSSRTTLRSRYALPQDTILGLFRAALEVRELAFEDAAAVEEALFSWQDSRSGFSDCLIIARNRRLGCCTTATFDMQAARLPGASPA